MKPKTLLLSAIILHFLVRTCWAFHIIIPEDTDTDFTGTNIYLTGIAIVFLLWTYYSKALIKHPVKQHERLRLNVINNTWMWFVWNDVLKELSWASGYFKSYFFNPTIPHIEEYILWIVACGYATYKFREIRRAERSNEPFR